MSGPVEVVYASVREEPIAFGGEGGRNAVLEVIAFTLVLCLRESTVQPGESGRVRTL